MIDDLCGQYTLRSSYLDLYLIDLRFRYRNFRLCVVASCLCFFSECSRLLLCRSNTVCQTTVGFFEFGSSAFLTCLRFVSPIGGCIKHFFIFCCKCRHFLTDCTIAILGCFANLVQLSAGFSCCTVRVSGQFFGAILHPTYRILCLVRYGVHRAY